jgi:hypothetical protein
MKVSIPLRSHTHPLADEIVAEQLKKPEALELITKLVQDVWSSQKIPQIWQQIKIMALDKPDGGTRGIAITAVSAKVLTRIIVDRIGDIPLADNQFGFRPGRNTVMAITTLKHRLHQFLQRGSAATIIFLDVSKAYDSVPRNQLWDLLTSYGLGPTTIAIIRCLYEDETTVTADTETETFKSTIGVRQGCVLSPIIFAIVMNEVIEKVRHEHPTEMILGYADDISIIAESTTTALAVATKFVEALAIFGMKLNMTKTEAMVCMEQISRDNTTGYFSRIHKLGLVDEATLQAAPSELKHNNRYLVVPQERTHIACPCIDCPYVARADRRTPPQQLLAQHVTHTHKNITTHVEIIRLATTRAGSTTDARHDTQPQPPTTLILNGQQIKVVTHFKYLGSYIANNLSDTVDVRARIQAATAAHGKLWRLWRSNKATRYLKAQIFKTIVIPVLTYASGTWAITDHQLRQLTTTYHKLARRAGNFPGSQQPDGTWHKASATLVRARLRLPKLDELLREERLRCYGQIIRLKSPLANTTLEACDHHKRGHINGCWYKQVVADMRLLNLTEVEATHRSSWETKTKAPRPAPNY